MKIIKVIFYLKESERYSCSLVLVSSEDPSRMRAELGGERGLVVGLRERCKMGITEQGSLPSSPSPLPLLQQGDSSGYGKTAGSEAKERRELTVRRWDKVLSSLLPSSLPPGAGDAMTSRSECHVENTALDVTACVQIQLVHLRIAWS